MISVENHEIIKYFYYHKSSIKKSEQVTILNNKLWISVFLIRKFHTKYEK